MKDKETGKYVTPTEVVKKSFDIKKEGIEHPGLFYLTMNRFAIDEDLKLMVINPQGQYLYIFDERYEIRFIEEG